MYLDLRGFLTHGKGVIGMIVNNNYLNDIRIRGNPPNIKSSESERAVDDFGKILKEKMDEPSELKFSKHAETRLQLRNIKLSSEQKGKLKAAVEKAGQKGVKDSLVIMDNLAFVVNVKNKTVVTAANSNELKENVFTNIDGAVFA